MNNKGTYKKNRFGTAIVLVIILSICLFAGLIFTVYLLDAHDIGSKYGISVNYDWISFLGNCISGFVGAIVPVSVMFYTIAKEKEGADENRRIQVMPLFLWNIDRETEDIKFENASGSAYYFPETFELDDNYFNGKFVRIKLKNVGDGHASDFRIYEERNGNYKKDSWGGIGGAGESGLLLKGESYEYFMHVNIDDRIKANWGETFVLHIFYKDCLDNIYEQKIDFTFGIGEVEEDNVTWYEENITWASIENAKLVNGFPE